MRIKTKATDLRKGMIAFLPYFGRLLRAKITDEVHPPTKTPMGGEIVAVVYEVLSEPHPRHRNMCHMSSTSEYEVYKRSGA